MADLHPHWRATGDRSADAALKPRATGTRVRVESQSVSRAPAAVVGILVVLAAAFTFFRGWELIDFNVLGQAGGAASAGSSSSGPAATMIRLAPTGIAPTSVVTTPGSLVTIVNNDNVPHIFSSKTLRDGSGKILETPAIFAGTSYTFRVYGDEVSGEHKMTSTTTASYIVTFTLVPAAASSAPAAGGKPLGTLDDVPLPSGMGSRSSVAAGGKASSSAVNAQKASTGSSASSIAVSSAPALPTPIVSSEASSAPLSSSAASSAVLSSAPSSVAAQSSSSSSLPEAVHAAASSSSDPSMGGAIVGNTMTADAAGIPLNPFTVGSRPAGSQQTPPAPARQTATPAKTPPAKTGTLHAGASLARTNVKTGPELWIALAGGLLGVVVCSRRQLVAIKKR